MQYNLYHTLNQNIPKKRFGAKEKKQLLSKCSHLDETGKEAFVMLIAEHARLHNDYTYTPSIEEIPYGGQQKGNDAVFNVSKFPQDLKWILYKFLGIACK